MMLNMGHVKNPLTIIAIFAGIAEVSGTVVITYLQPNQGDIFVWFLVFFPTLLVTAFFVTLNFNHKVLYAPSDYEDENNFLKVHKYDSLTQTTKIEFVKESLDIKRADYFEDTAYRKIYNIDVSEIIGADSFVGNLKGEGYTARIYKSISGIEGPLPSGEHQAIWLGSRVPATFAINIIKKAKKAFPFLRYIQYSDDGKYGGGLPPDYVHDQIFIGGSTSTARSYELKEIPDKEMEELNDVFDDKTLREFVQRYYKE